MIAGTIKNSVKLQFMQNQWEQKKNDINAKKQVKEMTQEERMLADFQEQVEKERESNSHADLYNKLQSGGKLTADEISYLEQNDPEALRKYREDQAEKESYERQLKNCKTKDEVERLKMNKLGNFAAQAKQITNDPYIPLDKKVELMKQLNDKVCRVNQAHMEFIDSQQYKDMPTEAELSEERTTEIAEKQETMLNDVMEAVSDSEDVENDEINYENDISTLSDTDMIEDTKENKMAHDNERRIEGKDDLSFETITSSINQFIISTGNREGKIDISL